MSQRLPDNWQQWVALNLMNGSPPEELEGILIKEGFAQALAAQSVTEAKAHPYVAAGSSLARQMKKRDWVLQFLSMLEEQSPQYPQVERRHKLSRNELFEEYYTQNKPVVITGMLDNWPAMTKWTPQYLKSKFGHLEVEVQAKRGEDPEYEINSVAHKSRMNFGDYIDMVHSGVETNEYYITANNTGHNATVLKELWEDTDGLPEYLKQDPNNPGFFWYGPKGIVTPLHHDLTNNFMAQVLGRKRIMLIPPTRLPFVYNHFHCYSPVDIDNIDYSRFPAFRNVHPKEVILAPGEILFLPVGYWHHVSGMDIVITMTYTNFVFPNDFSAFYSTTEHL